MILEKNKLFHIYNQGNNREKIFYDERNYDYFLFKLKRYVHPYADILAWCLMPNHFHLMVYVRETEIYILNDEISKKQKIRSLNESIGILLRTYTRAINKQENRTGSLFTQNTKAKVVTDWRSNMNYGEICFNYIHKNPLSSNLVKSLENWPYSSYYEYTGKIANPICNVDLGKNLFYIRWTKYIENIKSEKIEKEALKLIF